MILQYSQYIKKVHGILWTLWKMKAKIRRRLSRENVSLSTLDPSIHSLNCTIKHILYKHLSSIPIMDRITVPPAVCHVSKLHHQTWSWMWFLCAKEQSLWQAEKKSNNKKKKQVRVFIIHCNSNCISLWIWSFKYLTFLSFLQYPYTIYKKTVRKQSDKCTLSYSQHTTNNHQNNF